MTCYLSIVLIAVGKHLDGGSTISDDCTNPDSEIMFQIRGWPLFDNPLGDVLYHHIMITKNLSAAVVLRCSLASILLDKMNLSWQYNGAIQLPVAVADSFEQYGLDTSFELDLDDYRRGENYL